MRATLRKMGNSQGVIIPKALIMQFGFEAEVEMRVTEDGIVLEKPETSVRSGWAQASQDLSKNDDDALVWPEFTNEGDEALTW